MNSRTTTTTPTATGVGADDRDPFHDGERAVQERMGVRARLAEVGGRVIRDHMPDQHRILFAQLPFIVVGVVDDDGRPRATVIAGPPGFVRSPDARTLAVAAVPIAIDPAAAGVVPGAPVGLLGIEMHTRRRNRANGIIAAREAGDAAGFVVDVKQSFGNCPKYIQARTARRVARTGTAPSVTEAARLDDRAIDLIRRADTFFIASAHPQSGADDEPFGGVDVSHRGGKPGFVGVMNDDVLVVPDFAGNFFFNTLGNLVSSPRAGLVFVDRDTGSLLQVSVDAEIVWDGPDVDAFAGAERLLRFTVQQVVRIDDALTLRFDEGAPSPFLEATGTFP